MLDFENWRDALNAQFRFFGLPACLTENELRELHAAGNSPDCAYGIACDIHAGFSLAEAIAASKELGQ